MTYRHNSTWQSRALNKTLVDHGRQLLDSLVRVRRSSEVSQLQFLSVPNKFNSQELTSALK
jgi:hypothetical protein